MLLSILALALGTTPSDAAPELSAYATPSFTYQDAAEEPPGWAGSVLLGFTDTSGNTDITNIALTADAVKELETHRYSAGLYWSYTANDGDITERKAGIHGQYDYLAGEHHYYFVNAAAETDKLASIELRYRAGIGAGYDVIETEKVNFAVQASLNYIVTQFRTVFLPAPYTKADDSAAALGLGWDYSNKLTEDTKFTQHFEAYPALSDVDDVYLRLDNRLSTNLTESMVGSIQYVWDWDNTPAQGAERSDHRLVISLGWTFGS